MNWTSARPWLGTLCRLVLGAILLWSALVKLSDPRAFLRGVLAYDVTPNWLGKGIAYGLPVLLLCLALLLVIGVLTRLAAAATAVVLVIIVVALLEGGIRGLRIDSAAFSNGGVVSTSGHLLLDLPLAIVPLLLAVLLVRWPYTHLSLDEFLGRNDYVIVPSAKRMRTEQGRRKYESEVARHNQIAKERNRYLTLALSILVVLVSLIGIGVQLKRAVILPDLPANADIRSGVTAGNKAPVTLDIYEDFQCPQCQTFERATVGDINSMITAGKIQVRYHVVAILDRNSNGNRYSSRAANAAMCAADITVKDFQKYSAFLFAKDGNGNDIMPAVGSHGRTDTSLIQYAKDALGIGDTDLSTYQTCVQSEEHSGYVLAATNNFTNHNYITVPTVIINGKRLTTLTLAGLNNAIAVAAAKAPPVKPTQSATPAAPASPVPPSAASSAP